MTAPLVQVASRTIETGRPAWIIAEIGINHEGSVEACARMVEDAVRAGADAVKLQTIDADANYVRGTESHALFSRAALTPEETARMFDLIRGLGAAPFTTAGDFATLDWIDRLDPAVHKISSGLLTAHPIIAHAAAKGRPLLMSTGMALPRDVEDAVAVAQAAGATEIALFHCVSIYPAPPERLQLSTIAALSARHGLPAGYSDHSDGIDAAPLAVAAGAVMIEKHFTFDHSRPSFDHRLSLEPDDFARMVRAVRKGEAMLGAPKTDLSEAERTIRERSHRCLVAARPIAKGERFTIENVAIKRPLPDRRGLEPKHYTQVIGRNSTVKLDTDIPITAEMISNLDVARRK